MSFPDIDIQKLHLILILFEDLLETHGSLDVGRSGITPKDQRYGLLAAKAR
jgi:hypothetical protein